MTAADVRDWDPGDGRISTPSTARAPAWSAGAPARPAPTLPPLDPDGGSAAPDWSEVVEHFREGLVVCDADGVVRQLSPVAERLLPEVTVGELLAAAGIAALATVDVAAEFGHRGRRLRVRRVNLSGARWCCYVEDVTESVTRADALLAERARSAFLAVVGEKLGNPLHPDRAAAATVRLAVPGVADVAVLVLAPRSGRTRWWRAVRVDDDAPAVDRGVLAAADLPSAIDDGLAGIEPHAVDWLVEQAVQAGWLPGLAVSDLSTRLVQLPGQGAPTGVLLVARRSTRPYDESDTDLLRAFAARAGAALTTALLYRGQTEVADTLQASLLPVEPVEAAGVQWGTAYRPAQAGLRIGGDFYGSHRLPGGGSLFFLGDVSGKGVEAAVFTGQLRQCLQALHRVESHPGRLLRLLNDALLETTLAAGQGRFATMVLGVVRPTRDGGLTLTMAGGGHLQPLVLRGSGEVETVPLSGMLIGVVPDPRIGEVTVRLEAGETCVLYSDGVTEARGGRRGDEQFGPARLTTALTGCHRMPAPALAERIEQVTCDWLAHGDHDDIAVLALRAVGVNGVRPGRHLHAVPDAASPPRRTHATPSAVGGGGRPPGAPLVTAPTAHADPAGAYPGYLDCLADADEYGAVDVALGLLAAGVSAERVLLDLVAPAQAEVGERWARNEWSVAQEHAATHISERVVAAVSSAANPRPDGGRVVVACMDGEWHALPPRLVAEVLRLRGWRVTFLGASVPAAHLVSYLHRHDAHAVALACALPMRLPYAHRMIEACRRSDVPVVVGGRGFGADGRWARRLGVAWAPDAPAAADLVADERALRRVRPAELSHLADDEYAGLVKRRAELIDSALADLRDRVPAMRHHDAAQLDSTVSDLGHLVDFLAAALYVDDGTLFTEFVDWLAAILTSRGAPPAALGPTLDHYGQVLRDFPRAGRFLAAAGRRVDERVRVGGG